MLVTVEFEKDGFQYRIERGRKPNVLRFYIGDHEQEPTDDSSQGDSRETQLELEKLLGMSHNMFKHIVALNTYTEPFLSMRANDQREIIEQLLGITQLSEKAESLKELVKETKSMIQDEEYRIKAVQDANGRIEEQIENLKRRQKLWLKKHSDDLAELGAALQELNRIDIEAEIENHRQIIEYNKKLAAKKEAQKWINSLTSDYNKEESLYLKLEKEIQDISEHKCYACGTQLHDSNQQEILAKKTEQRQECEAHMLALESRAAEYHTEISTIGELSKPPVVFYDTMESATDHRNTVGNLENQIKRKAEDVDPYAEQIDEMEKEEIVNRLKGIK
jgi:DNA repair exonuclease SbcCD ATPase subunit